MSLADTMLAGGCISHLDAVHGELVKILDGPDAGKSFTAVQETEPDLRLDTDLGEDLRAKRILRFNKTAVPNILSQGRVQTADGKIWNAVRNPQDGYLTTDFELREIVPGKDA